MNYGSIAIRRNFPRPSYPSGLLTIYPFLRGYVLMETRQKVSQAPRNETQKTAQPPVLIVVS